MKNLVKIVFSQYYNVMNTNILYTYLERLSELLRVEARKKGAEQGLQPIQVEILHYLSQCNRFSDTPMAVTEYLRQTKGTVSQTLKVLEKKGFLHKRPDPNDKRSVHLKLTTAGQKFVSEAVPFSVFQSVCADLSSAQKQNLEQGLHFLLFELLKANQAQTFGVCKSCRYNQKLPNSTFFCQLVGEELSPQETQLICREHVPV